MLSGFTSIKRPTSRGGWVRVPQWPKQAKQPQWGGGWNQASWSKLRTKSRISPLHLEIYIWKWIFVCVFCLVFFCLKGQFKSSNHSIGQLAPLQVLSLTCRLHSSCEEHATSSSHCLTTETYLTLFWPDFLFVYVAAWGSDLEQLAYHQRALTQILRSVWQRGHGEKMLQGIISDRRTRAFYTSAQFLWQLQLLKHSNVELWLWRLQILWWLPSMAFGWVMEEDGRYVTREIKIPAIPGLGFPSAQPTGVKPLPSRGQSPRYTARGPLKRAAWGEVRARVSEIKCKKRSKRK